MTTPSEEEARAAIRKAIDLIERTDGLDVPAWEVRDVLLKGLAAASRVSTPPSEEAADPTALADYIDRWYDRWAGPGESWTAADLADSLIEDGWARPVPAVPVLPREAPEPEPWLDPVSGARSTDPHGGTWMYRPAHTEPANDPCAACGRRHPGSATPGVCDR